jgi:uncharacterized protein
MTPTAFAFVYRPGPAWIRDRPLAEQKLGPHARYMGELFARGRLLLGGPFLDTGGGFALVAADTEDEAREIFARDPAIVDGVFAGDVRSWCAVFDRHDLASSARNLDTARRVFEAVEARDGSALLSLYARDVTIHEAPSLPYGGSYHGHDGAVRHGVGFTQTWDRFQDRAELRALAPEFFAARDSVVVVWRHRAEREGARAIDLPAVSVYRLADGLVVESRMFHFDTTLLADFLASPPPA